MVINAVTIQTAYQALNLCKENGYEKIELVSIAVSRGQEAGDKHLLKALNPVFIISAQKGEI